MLEALNFMSIKGRLEFNVCLLVYKIMNGMCPKYLSRDIKIMQASSNINTRKGDDFCIGRCKTREEQMLLHDGFKMYNNLPNAIKSKRTVRKFKGELVKYILGRERGG